RDGRGDGPASRRRRQARLPAGRAGSRRAVGLAAAALVAVAALALVAVALARVATRCERGSGEREHDEGKASELTHGVLLVRPSRWMPTPLPQVAGSRR